MNHSVRKETLHATVDSEAMALELQPRLQELNRTVFREVVERVFDEFSTPDQHIRIESLTVDLGAISIGDFEWVAVNRLERALREALRRSVHEAEVQPSSRGRALSAAEAQAELVERYLLTGTLPFWAPSRSFSLADAMAGLATSDPEGLANLLARHATDAVVRDRLSHQLSRDVLRVRVIDPVVTRLDRQALEYLIRQLDPLHADRIVAEVDALDERLRTSGHADTSRARRDIWSVAIAERLGVRGDSFDSVSFARSLREGIAGSDARREAQDASAETGQHEPHRTTLKPEPERRDEPSSSSIADATVGAPADPMVDRADDRSAPVRSADEERDRLAAALRHEADELDDRAAADRPWTESRFLNRLDATHVVTRVIASLLDVTTVGTDVDTDDGPRRDHQTPDSPLDEMPLAFSDVRDWDTARIRSALRARAQAVASGDRGHEPSSAHLLLQLIELDVDTARQLIGALIATGLRPSVLIDERLTSRDVDLLLRLLSVEASTTVSRFVSTFATLPGAGRASRDIDRSDVALDRSHGPAPSQDIWEADRIVTELRSRAQAAPVAADPSSTSLLVRLIEQDTAAAREFVTALRSAGLRPSSLIDSVPAPAAIDVLQQFLPSDAARDLTTLARALSEPSRVGRTEADAALRAVLIAEALAQDLSVPAGAIAGEASAAVVPDERRTVERVERVERVEPIEGAIQDAAGIVAVLRRRALSGIVTGPSSMSLLLRLIDEDLDAARQFVRSLMDAGVQPSSLVDDLSAPSTIERIAALLSEDSAQTVTLLSKVLHAIAHRASDAVALMVEIGPAAEPRAQTILLREVLDHDIVGAFSRVWITRTLRRLLGSTLSPASRELLIATANRLVEAGEVKPAPLAALVDALTDVPDVSPSASDSTLIVEPSPFDAAEPEELTADESTAIEWLRDHGEMPANAAARELADEELRVAVRHAMERAPTAVRRAVTEHLEDPRARRWWVSALSDAELSTLARLLEPHAHEVVVEAANVLFSSWFSLVPDTQSSRERRGDFWSVVLEVLASMRSASPVTTAVGADAQAGPPGGTAKAREESVTDATRESESTRAQAAPGDADGVRLLSGESDAHVAVAGSPGSTSSEPHDAEAVSADSTPGVTGGFEARQTTGDAELSKLQEGEPPKPEGEKVSASNGPEAPQSPGAEVTRPARTAPPESESTVPAEPDGASGVAAVPRSPHGLGDAGVLDYQAAAGDLERWPLTQLTRRFFAVFGADRESLLGEPARPREIGEALARAAVRDATAAGHTALRATLVRDRTVLLALARGEWPGDPAAADARQPRRRDPDPPASRVNRLRTRTAFSMDESSREIGEEPIYIANAGLILINPFLPQLFSALDVLERDEDGAVHVARSEVSRVVHLLQSLVDGRTSAPEPLLCLNKILCGVPMQTPIARSIEPQPRDLKACTTLLSSMIAHWPILSGTSIAGLQETFLQREGRLEKTAEGWRLVVQRKTLDVLLDHIPWSISTVFHSWMAAPIYVTW